MTLWRKVRRGAERAQAAGSVRGRPRCPPPEAASPEGKGRLRGLCARVGAWGGRRRARFSVCSALLGVSGEHRPDLASPPPVPVPDFGRFTSIPDVPSQLQTASLEDLLCPHAPLSGEDAAAPSCGASSHAPFKAFLSPPELHAPRSADRKLPPLLSPLQDPLLDKTLLEPREMARPKKVCFSESSLTSGDRTRRSYYLNGRQGGPGRAAAAGKGVGGRRGTASPAARRGEDSVPGRPGSGAAPVQIFCPFKENRVAYLLERKRSCTARIQVPLGDTLCRCGLLAGVFPVFVSVFGRAALLNLTNSGLLTSFLLYTSRFCVLFKKFLPMSKSRR